MADFYSAARRHSHLKRLSQPLPISVSPLFTSAFNMLFVFALIRSSRPRCHCFNTSVSGDLLLSALRLLSEQSGAASRLDQIGFIEKQQRIFLHLDSAARREGGVCRCFSVVPSVRVDAWDGRVCFNPTEAETDQAHTLYFYTCEDAELTLTFILDQV